MKMSASGAYLLVALLIGALSFTSEGCLANEVERHYSALIKVEDEAVGRLTTRERGIRVANAYDLHFSRYTEESLSKLTTDELRVYLRATELVLVNSLRAKDLARMESAFNEIVRRDAATRLDLERMYKAYISMRRFDAAGALTQQHAVSFVGSDITHMSTVPLGFRGSTLLDVSPTEAKLTRVTFVPPSDPYIVIVSHPMCHFSQRAIAAIQKDSKLSSIFQHNAFWIAPVDGRLNFEVVQSWNTTHPEFRVSLAFNRDEWPEIDYWGTPTFYFFGKEGLAAKVVGWPKEGRRSELLSAARKAGIRLGESAPDSTD
jgi:hypothetical protein